MQRLLAIDCDARELCFVLATAVGDRVTLDAAATISLEVSDGDAPKTANEWGRQLQVELARYKRAGTKVLLGVDRNAMESFEFTVPPASDAELPELVLNQVTTESANIADDNVIDFIPRPGAATEPRRVAAVALLKTELARLQSLCTSAGITADRMLVRPFETAALFLRSRAATSNRGHSLVVNVIADEVDLIVVDADQPVFFRTVRLPGQLGDEAANQRILHEIRRTLLIAPQNADAGQVIATVALFGTSEVHHQIVQQLSTEGLVNAEAIDPVAGFILGNDWEPPSTGRIVPLLGMLLEEARGGRHAVDFLHPRRVPIPPNRRRQIAIAAIVIALVGGTGGYLVLDTFRKADDDIRKLADDLSDLDSRVKKTIEKKKVTAAVTDWNSNSVVWLDELRDLSAKLPSGQDLVLQRLSMTPSRGGKASISFQGLVREPKVVTRMESTLRDDRHEVQTPRVEERVQDKAYTWSFDTAVSVTPAIKDVDDSKDRDQPITKTGKSKNPTSAESSKRRE